MYTLYNNDCYEQLKSMLDNSVDSIVTDPPYGLGKQPDIVEVMKDWVEKGHHDITGKGFMGKEWDSFVPQPLLWKECFRVLKPGGHLLSFFGSRTYDIGSMAIRFAGFEIRDTIMYIYGSGFPKSLNIGKAIDDLQGNEREIIYDDNRKKRLKNQTEDYDSPNGWKTVKRNINLTKGNSEHEGWQTNLKPAVEPIVLARKPISENTIVENVLRWGTGGINIEDCRIESSASDIEKIEKTVKTYSNLKSIGGDGIYSGGNKYDRSTFSAKNGRFPSNVIHDGSNEVLENFPYTKSGGGNKLPDSSNVYIGNSHHHSKTKGFNQTYQKDEGSASRFFYCAKVSPSERNMGFEKSSEKQNTHPTLKPLSLMKYLVRLVTPRNGIVLDPFMGSGTTGMACVLEGFNFIGIEREKEYFDIANVRINYVENNKEEVIDKKKNKSVKKEKFIENKKQDLTIF